MYAEQYDIHFRKQRKACDLFNEEARGRGDIICQRIRHVNAFFATILSGGIGHTFSSPDQLCKCHAHSSENCCQPWGKKPLWLPGNELIITHISMSN